MSAEYFIKLLSPSGTAIYIDARAINAVRPSGGAEAGSVVEGATHSPLFVSENTDTVFAKIEYALRAYWASQREINRWN